MVPPSFTIIGTGAVGSALATQLFKRGYQPHNLINRSVEKARSLSRSLNNCTCHMNIQPGLSLGDLVFITTPDDVIPDVVEKLYHAKISWSDITVVHCSGALTSVALAPLGDKGASVVAAHPIQSFGRNTAGIFKDIYFSLEGSERGIEIMKELVTQLGSHYQVISPNGKMALHTAAVFASNYLTVLLNEASNICKKADIEEEKALAMLRPLIETTIKNIIYQGSQKSLTGPVRRGDIKTVKKHLEIVSNDRNSLYLYVRLALRACDMVSEFDVQKAKDIKELKSLLNSYDDTL